MAYSKIQMRKLFRLGFHLPFKCFLRLRFYLCDLGMWAARKNEQAANQIALNISS